MPHRAVPGVPPCRADGTAICRYPPRVVRFFTASALALALGTSTAAAQARPKHHRRAATHHHHYAAKSKAKKAKDKAKPAADDDQDKSEHEVKQPGKAKGSAKEGSRGKATEGVPKVVETQKKGTGKEAIKTYKFGPQEVEGRLKSPQIIYFLRRVRAEFEAGDLGHRSFMRELSDTRRDPAFR